jgi:phage recombination protein Bet
MNTVTKLIDKKSNNDLATQDFLKSIFAKGATDQELKLFGEICKQRNLNPIFRQIYFMKIYDSMQNKEVMSPVVSIEGFRCIAERSGKYAGQTIPLFCGKNGVWSEIWTENEPPFACKIGVHRDGFREPIYNVAQWKSFAKYKKNGELTTFWQKFPTLMLAKCAESGALRKAFPEDLSGLYAQEELEQAVNDDKINVEYVEEKQKQIENKIAQITQPKKEEVKQTPTQQEEIKSIVIEQKIQSHDEQPKQQIRGKQEAGILDEKQREQLIKDIVNLTEFMKQKYPLVELRQMRFVILERCENDYKSKKLTTILNLGLKEIVDEIAQSCMEFYGENDK